MSVFIIILSFVFLYSFFLIIGGIMMKSRYSIYDVHFWWRILMITTGIVLSVEVTDIYIQMDTFFTSDVIPFSIRLMLEWFVIALMVSSIISASLENKLTLFQKAFFPCLLFCCLLIALCYDYFAGTYTRLYKYTDIFDNLDKKDVQVKVFIFMCSILSTAYMLFVPFLRKLKKKEIVFTKWFWIYLFFAILQPVTYVLYALGSQVSGVVLGAGCMTFMVIYTIAFFRSDTPLLVTKYSEAKITPPVEEKKEIAKMDISQRTGMILSSIISEDKLFLNKNLSIDELCIKTSLPLSSIISEYQKQGFTNFSDYLNSFRLPYFKDMLKANPKVPISVLAADCGFPSRSSFYRYFQSAEGISPVEYKTREGI